MKHMRQQVNGEMADSQYGIFSKSTKIEFIPRDTMNDWTVNAARNVLSDFSILSSPYDLPREVEFESE